MKVALATVTCAKCLVFQVTSFLYNNLVFFTTNNSSYLGSILVLYVLWAVFVPLTLAHPWSLGLQQVALPCRRFSP